MLYTTQVQILSLFIIHDSLAQTLCRHTPNPLNLKHSGWLYFYLFFLSYLKCILLELFNSAWADRLFTLAQTVAIVFLILHYRGDTVRGEHTHLQILQRQSTKSSPTWLSPRQAGPSTLIQIIKWFVIFSRQRPPVFTFSIWYWVLEI